jgi:DNA polymerase I-like protein with 3'-5' exonuclease and polymerase domains
MNSIALIETKPSKTNFVEAFNDAFKFDRFSLCSDPSLKKVLKKDVDIEFDPDAYEWIILVGSDACKYFTKIGSVSEYSGKIVDEKFIPIINPAMLSFKPEAEKLWQESRTSVINYVTGKQVAHKYSTDKFYGIQDTEQAILYVQQAIDSPNPFVAIDSETSALYPRDGHILGVSLCYERDHAAYIDINCFTPKLEAKFQELFNKKIVIFHNAKFDMAWFAYHFGWTFPKYEDTMLLHYLMDENPGNHGLKSLALKFTEYGDYEKDLHEFIVTYRKEYGVLKEDFSWGVIPFETMYPYAAMDSAVTFLLYCKFKPAINKNKKLTWVYDNLLIPGCSMLIDMQENGVPFDRARLQKAQQMMQTDIDTATDKLYVHEVIRDFEKEQGKEFNPGSTQQLRKLLFDFVGLSPTGKKTGTNADSTDKEVLAELGQQHEIPNLILDIRQRSKIKNTYLDKIIPALDSDSRLRTNFNLHSTTSGRLSSSGKLNMQQLPRDNPAVKGCIKAAPGHKIVSMDLTTAEVYVAAVLSGDKELMQVFQSGGDFHSTVAKKVFKLPCDVKDVKVHYKLLRQAAKAITFGILYGAGPEKIAWQVTMEGRRDDPNSAEFTLSEAKDAIKDYFKTFSRLDKWIKENQAFINENGFTYSQFGRKRRLPNVFSSDRGIKGHTVRSGINFLIQSVASDVNLLAAIDMMAWIKSTGSKARMFALVHDSILAEVPNEEIDSYCENLARFVQMDRGVSIPGTPIGCDFEIGEDYSYGIDEETGKSKYEQYEEKWDAAEATRLAQTVAA